MQLKSHEIFNTFGIKVKAQEYAEYCSKEELLEIIPTLKGKKVLHVGGGSNLLFTTDVFDGVVLHNHICSIEQVGEDEDSVLLKVGGGMVWDDFVAYTVEHGWSGAENLSLIPGEVGASAVQNIGAYGAEAKDIISEVECVDLHDGQTRIFRNDECQYSYRKSIFKGELKGQYAVAYVTYKLSKHFTPKLDYGNIRSKLEGVKDITPKVVRDAIIGIRQSKLPNPEEIGNGGSFFMNPVVSEEKFNEIYSQYPQMPFYKVEGGVKIPAGWMIEQSGWKGKSQGNAGVYEKQALILVNLGGATGGEILDLCKAVQKSVFDKFGIEIHPEVNVI